MSKLRLSEKWIYFRKKKHKRSVIRKVMNNADCVKLFGVETVNAVNSFILAAKKDGNI